MIIATLTDRRDGRDEQRKVKIATEWSEIRFDQFRKIMQMSSAPTTAMIQIISILTDFSEEMVLQMPERSLEQVLPYLHFLNDPPKTSKWKRPDEIMIKGQFYRVPIPKECTFGQKVYLQQEINAVLADDNRSSIDLMPYAVALYMYPIVTGDKTWTEEKITEFIPVIERCLCTDIIPVGGFFLTRYLRSQKWKERLSVFSRLKNKQNQELQGSTSSAS